MHHVPIVRVGSGMLIDPCGVINYENVHSTKAANRIINAEVVEQAQVLQLGRREFALSYREAPYPVQQSKRCMGAVLSLL